MRNKIRKCIEKRICETKKCHKCHELDFCKIINIFVNECDKDKEIKKIIAMGFK